MRGISAKRFGLQITLYARAQAAPAHYSAIAPAVVWRSYADAHWGAKRQFDRRG